MKKGDLLIFVGDFQYNSGSSQTLLYYLEAAKDLGLKLAITGYIADDKIANYLPFIPLDEWPQNSLIIYIFESVLYLDPEINPGLLERYLAKTKDKRRIIIDTDVSYTPKPTNRSEKKWKNILEKFEAPILQPCVSKNNFDSGRIKIFPFFVFPKPFREKINKTHNVVYVGNNWHRKREMENFVWQLGSSGKVSSMAIYGKNWGRFLVANNFCLSLRDSVPPNEVVKTMSTGVFNPVFISRSLLEKKVYTPRMFETLAAQTIPLFPANFDYVTDVYGQVEGLVFNSGNLGEVIARIMRERKRVESFLVTLREKLYKSFSAQRLLKILLNYAYSY